MLFLVFHKRRDTKPKMEFQNADNNDAGNNVAGNNDAGELGNNNDKQTYICYCGCGLTFIKGVELGFGLKTNNEDYLYEHKIEGINWNDYLSNVPIQTWGGLMDLIAESFRNDSNNRIWFHLHPYVQDRHLVAYNMPIQFIYIN